MSTRGEIEIIARGVFIEGEQVLLCHSIGAQNTFLPGGHVEFRETARRSLEREMEEELGLASSSGAFLGGVENAFLQGDVVHCEVNVVFRLDIPGIDASAAPRSRERGIEFLWVAIDRLGEACLEPAPLCGLVPEWHGAAAPQVRWVTSGGCWAG